MAQKNSISTSIEVTSVVCNTEGKPIKGAEITAIDRYGFTYTNSLGFFKIQIPLSGTIVVETPGYESKTLSVEEINDTVFLVKSPFLVGTDDLVYLPFEYKPYKRNIVGSVFTFNPNNTLNFDNTQYVTDALLGKVPGLSGSQSILGIGNAVFVVDGVAGRDISSLTIQEVSQISVLKDANAAVLYGVQAQNGVVMITTKKGVANSRKINIQTESGLSFVKEFPKYLNAIDYMKYYNLGRKNDGLAALYDSATIANTANGTNIYKYPNVNYYDKTFIRNFRPFEKIMGEFQGGDDNTLYYLNLGWTNTGTLLNLGEGREQKDNRFNLRANIDFKINNYISSNFNIASVLDFSRTPNSDFWSLASTVRPNAYSPLLPINQIQNLSDFPLAKSFGDFILGGSSLNPSDNIYGEMLLSGQRFTQNRSIQVSQGFKINLNDLVKGLYINSNLSFDLHNTFTNLTNNSYAVYESKWLKKNDLTDSMVVAKIGNDIQTGNQTIPTTSVDFIRKMAGNVNVNYTRTLNVNHKIFTSVLAYVNSLEQNDTILDKFYPHLGAQFNYAFKQKYLLDFSSSYVSSVKLKSEYRKQFSPTVGLAWVLTEEDFLRESKWVDYLKLRTSAGIIKSDINITNYYLYENSFASITGGGTVFSWADGGRSSTSTIISNLANPMLNFEQRKNYNLGFETALFDKSLWVEANLFQDSYSGLASKMTSVYPAYLGGLNPTVNFGENLYQGVEVGLNLTQHAGDFTFCFGGNMTYLHSEVIKKDELYLDSYQNRVGKSVDAIFGLQSIGLYKESDFIDATKGVLKPCMAVPAFGTVKPGDIKYKNQNSDNVIDTKDEVMIGNYNPEVYLGLNLNFNYKGFTFFVLLTAQQGAESNLSGNYYWVYGNSMKYSDRILGAWNVDMTEAQKSAATYPRLSTSNSSNNFRQSDYWLANNDFINIQRIQLTYELPKGFLQKISMKGLSIYLRGSNLWTIAQNAELRDLNIGTEPQFRNYSAGLRANF